MMYVYVGICFLIERFDRSMIIVVLFFLGILRYRVDFQILDVDSDLDYYDDDDDDEY